MRSFEICLREALDITLGIGNDLIICILPIRVSPLHFHVLNAFHRFEDCFKIRFFLRQLIIVEMHPKFELIA